MKFKVLLLAAAIMLGITASFSAEAYEPPVCIYVNGSKLAAEDVPFLDNGVTYVPVRYLSKIFNASDISWNAKTSTATVFYSGHTVVITEKSSTAVVDGVSRKMNGEARVVNGSLYVPVRFFADAFEAQVDWIQNYYRVELYKDGLRLSDSEKTVSNYNDDHIYWLAKIISCESSGESIGGKIGVGNVILNRVESESFPDTIYTVIFDDNYGVQFQPVQDGTIYSEPTGEAYMAAKLALEGENTAGDSLYFLNSKTATNFWIPNNRVFFTSIGNHDFYL